MKNRGMKKPPVCCSISPRTAERMRRNTSTEG
nr:MAG TPA: hypothetical protein [Caudoviricetes sp.]DAT10449.1 MAG TPA: hypothetical protein [Caudoviricetes sp.]DAU43036.1 MAG TPA: hypothetical protein [Bacteriophage sp.]